ncbi:MAG: hypothetical protein AAF907_14440 [Planctomycetota bacterium]
MWDAAPERLKQHWTGRRVIVRVDQAVGTLARFAGLKGTVRTVNMNGRALVQFDGKDETWFDLDPRALEEAAAEPDPPPKPDKPAARTPRRKAPPTDKPPTRKPAARKPPSMKPAPRKPPSMKPAKRKPPPAEQPDEEEAA